MKDVDLSLLFKLKRELWHSGWTSVTKLCFKTCSELSSPVGEVENVIS